MKNLIVTFFLLSQISAFAIEPERPQATSASARIEEPSQNWEESQPEGQPLAIPSAVPAATEEAEVAPTSPRNEAPVLSEKDKKRLAKWEQKMQHDRFKAKLERAKEAHGVESATFEDIIVLAGAIVTVVGILSIIFNPITGVIVALLGILTYVLGTQAGGSLSNIF